MSKVLAIIFVLFALPVSSAVASNPRWGYHYAPTENCNALGVCVEDVPQMEKATDGADMIRFNVNWAGVEPVAPVSIGGLEVHTYRWGRLDQLYALAMANGVRPLFTVYASPLWSRPSQPSNECSIRVCAFPPDRGHYNDWGQFVEALMQRYPQSDVEVWNEPNLYAFWASGISISDYFLLLKETHFAAERASFDGKILAAAAAPILNTTAKSLSQRDYLRQLFKLVKAQNIKPYDALAIHPYPLGHRNPITAFTDQIKAVKKLQLKGVDRSKLWITEIGVGGVSSKRERKQALASATLPKSMITSESEQGPRLVKMYQVASRLDVRAFIVYIFQHPLNATPFWQSFAVLNEDFSAKPVYYNLRSNLG